MAILQGIGLFLAAFAAMTMGAGLARPAEVRKVTAEFRIPTTLSLIAGAMEVAVWRIWIPNGWIVLGAGCAAGMVIGFVAEKICWIGTTPEKTEAWLQRIKEREALAKEKAQQSKQERDRKRQEMAQQAKRAKFMEQSQPTESLRGVKVTPAALRKPQAEKVDTILTTTEDTSTKTCQRCGNEILTDAEFRRECEAEGAVVHPLTGKPVPKEAAGLRSLNLSRLIELENQRGFRCRSCGRVYCMDCLYNYAPAHRNGGKACPKCGGGFEVLGG